MNYTCLTIDSWTRKRRHTSTSVLYASVPSAPNGGLTVKLTPKVFDFTMDIPSCRKALKVETPYHDHDLILTPIISSQSG
jgi:hypothetical protein